MKSSNEISTTSQMNPKPINTQAISATKPFERFRQFTKEVMAVTKSEIDKREAEWKKTKYSKPFDPTGLR